MLTHDQAVAYFTYTTDGRLLWAEKIANKVVIGREAGHMNDSGYRCIRVGGRIYRSHRIIWLIHKGAWPSGEIDHINGIRLDNRIENLRDVTDRENSQNIKRCHRDCASGLLGAYLNKETGRWYSNIKLADRQVRIGTFDTAEEAHQAYLMAKRKHHKGNTL
jgi:hypothetical protein